ncbi:dihydrolipoyl dehydrogenase family protein [Pseudoprimorskyibacter insulae]|nr:FAD-dependent oxidoreductase [Pseudoprimorskyibacter insulae]
MERLKTDLLVIGAGSGGLSVAAGAVQMGAKVILLEGGKMGGDCLNYGCVPSKALLASGKIAHTATVGDKFGIQCDRPEIDYGAAMDHVADVIAQIAPVDSQDRFEGLGVRVIREYGRFVGPRDVVAGRYRIRARRIVIATGSSPVVPPIPGLETVPYVTNETVWAQRTPPRHLLIVGGGPIGLEMAQAHRRLGSAVTVIEAGRALPQDDPDLTRVVVDALRNEGITIAEGATAEEVRKDGDLIEVRAKDGRLFRGSHLMLAVGRKANLARLDLDKAGIKASATNIKVDAALKTSNRRVYAIGDVTGGMQFTHVAGYQAGVVVRSALFGLPAKAKTDHIPYCTYTEPELAQVGLTEAQAKEKYETVEVIKSALLHNDRAITERRTDGFIKLMVVKGRPVGVSIVGHQAGELIALWSMVIANNMKLSQVASMVAPYPTIAELNKRAAGTYFSPRLFESDLVKAIVRFVQRWLP